MLLDWADLLLHLPVWLQKLISWLVDPISMHEMFCEREVCFS